MKAYKTVGADSIRPYETVVILIIFRLMGQLLVN